LAFPIRRRLDLSLPVSDFGNAETIDRDGIRDRRDLDRVDAGAALHVSWTYGGVAGVPQQ
jgi:hypothetical protein